MSKRNIHIENLQIRLPKNAAGRAREIAGSVGNEILRGLAESTSGKRGAMRVENMTAKRTASAGGAESAAKAAAEKIAAEIAVKFK